MTKDLGGGGGGYRTVEHLARPRQALHLKEGLETRVYDGAPPRPTAGLRQLAKLQRVRALHEVGGDVDGSATAIQHHYLIHTRRKDKRIISYHIIRIDYM